LSGLAGVQWRAEWQVVIREHKSCWTTYSSGL
jgi:hypothetical protein